MSEWYRFEPQDTLFFRGAEPAVMGESHTATFNFPPPPQTLAGALRTAVLMQNGVKISEYKKASCNPAVVNAIGKAGEESPFGIIGPLFETHEGLWLPCPYTWFAEKDALKNLQEDKGRVSVMKAKPIDYSGSIAIKTSSGQPPLWVKAKEPESLGAFWVSLADFNGKEGEKLIKKENAFFIREPHTGIAMDYGAQRRTARKHHLYSFVHARLKEGVKLVFGVTVQLPLSDTGILTLGAEQRFGRYEKIPNLKLPNGISGLFMSLSLVEGDAAANEACVATGKIRYLGGWNMDKEFHKDMKGFFPTGTVFNQNIKDQCLQL